jgi:putative ABC transport system substrate-binding protein
MIQPRVLREARQTMRRRDLIAMLGGATVIWPVAAAAQAKTPQLGWLMPGTSKSEAPQLEEFRRGLAELGYVEGRTVAINYVYANGQLDRLPGLAAGLVGRKIDIILTYSTPGCLAAKQATTTLPIVCAASSDPLTTGISLMASDLSTKRLELLQSLVPRVSQVAVLWTRPIPAWRSACARPRPRRSGSRFCSTTPAPAASMGSR